MNIRAVNMNKIVNQQNINAKTQL